MTESNGSANGRPNAHPDPDRSSNAQATPEHAQARDGVLTSRARRLTARRLEHALADPALKPSTLEAAPGVTYRARGVTSQLARVVRDVLEDGYLDGYGVTNATAVMPWATAHLTADLAREVRRRRLGRELTPEEADRAALRPLRSKVSAAVTYLAAIGAYAYRPGDGQRPAQLAYAPAVLEEVTVTRSSRRGGHPPWGEGGVTPRRVTRSRSSSVEKSPATISTQGPTSSAPSTASVTSPVVDAYLDAIAAHLAGLTALRTLEAEHYRDDRALRAVIARTASTANGHDPARVVARVDLRRGPSNFTGNGWNLERLTDRLSAVLKREAPAAIAALTADAHRRAALEREAGEREAIKAGEHARLTPMPADLRARIGRPAPAATPVPVLEEHDLDDRRAVLEHAATSRRLSDGELAELERLTLAAIVDGLAAERTAAYLLDPPHLDRVLEHAVAPSPVLERAPAVAAFAQLLTARRRHATPPPGDAVLAALEHRLGRTLTLSELDLLDALPVTLTAPDAATLDAWAASELTLTASTGRP